MNRKIKVICSDLDGTLLNSNKKISSKNLKAIKKWQKDGNLFGITTGRSEPGVEMLINKDMRPDFIVCVNGARVHQLSGNLKVHTLKKDETNLILEIMESVNTHEYSLTVSGLSTWVNQVPLIGSDSDELVEKVATKVYTKSNLKLLLDKLKQYPFDTTWSDSNYVEVVAKGISKYSGLLESLENKYCMDEVAAVGDYENDLEIISHVGLGVAVGNAIPKLKEKSDVIVNDNNNDAIADLIYKLNDWERIKE